VEPDDGLRRPRGHPLFISDRATVADFVSKQTNNETSFGLMAVTHYVESPSLQFGYACLENDGLMGLRCLSRQHARLLAQRFDLVS
jgi:hypothetical protein